MSVIIIREIPDYVEVQPCRFLGTYTRERRDMEVCEETAPDIACWTVYWHLSRGGVSAIKDFDTRAEATAAGEFLLEALRVLAE